MQKASNFGMDRPEGGPSAQRPRVLAVDADQAAVQQVAAELRMDGFLVDVARSGEEALRMGRRIRFEVVVADLNLSSMTDFRLLRRLRENDPHLPILVCAERDDLTVASEAIRVGAYDYVTKPVQVDTLLIRVRKALERRRLTDRIHELDSQVRGRQGLGELVGVSVPMQSVYRSVEQVAAANGTVLILGEDGTGKELVAREIHRLSRWRERPFEVVSCMGIGLTRGGAGAPVPSEWALDRADGEAWMGRLASLGCATLYLAGIENLRPAQQAGLLRALEWIEKRPCEGGQGAAVRVIAATSADVDGAMEEGRLLADLCYRLSDSVIRVPALRERGEDVRVLCDHFLELECGRLGKTLKRLSPRSLQRLTEHDWPGNVTELQAVIRSAVETSKRPMIHPQDLPWNAEIGPPLSGPYSLAEVERRQIEAALKKTSGNKFSAAKLLGIGRSTFYRKLSKM